MIRRWRKCIQEIRRWDRFSFSLSPQASFVAAGNRTDISLEDPDFWQKWAKKAELDMDAINGRVSLRILNCGKCSVTGVT